MSERKERESFELALYTQIHTTSIIISAENIHTHTQNKNEKKCFDSK